MVTVRFVRVEKEQERQMLSELCRYMEGWVAAGRRIVVLTSDANAAARVDDALWTFSDVSFVPHSVLGNSSSALDRIVIAPADADILRGDVFVNLTRDVVPPTSFEDAAQDIDIWEFVKSFDPEARNESHRKWQRYREFGLKPAEGRLE